MLGKLVLVFTLLSALLALPAHAKESVESRLVERSDAGVDGRATFTHSPPDTIGHAEIKGLRPGSTARILVHAGKCSGGSANFVTLAEVAADAKGKAVGDGLLLFRETESIEFTTVADGNHSVSVAQQDKVVACGEIPKQGTQAAAAGTDEPPWITYAGIATGVVVLAGVALFLVRRRKAKSKSSGLT